MSGFTQTKPELFLLEPSVVSVVPQPNPFHVMEVQRAIAGGPSQDRAASGYTVSKRSAGSCDMAFLIASMGRIRVRLKADC